MADPLEQVCVTIYHVMVPPSRKPSCEEVIVTLSLAANVGPVVAASNK